MSINPDIEVYCPNGHLSIQTDISKIHKLHNLIDLGCQVCDSKLSIKTIDSRQVHRSKVGNINISENKDKKNASLNKINWKKITNDGSGGKVFYLTDSNRNYVSLPKVSAHISQLLPIKAALMIIGSDIHLKNKDIRIWKTNGIEDDNDFINPKNINENEGKKYIKIATKNISNNKPWEYTSRVELWVQILSEMRCNLYNLEEIHKDEGAGKRGNRPSAGFPSHHMEPAKRFNELGNDIVGRKKLEKKSAMRFKNTVIGTVKSDEENKNHIAVGALYSLGMIDFHVERSIKKNIQYLDLYYALTKEGYKFMNIENELLNKLITSPNKIKFNDLMNKFSKDETEFFYEHCKNNLDTEFEGLVNIIKYLYNIKTDSDLSPEEKEKLTSINEITSNLTDSITFFENMKRSSLVDPRKAYTSSLLNRWVGLKILIRPNRGKYSINEEYSYLYENILENLYQRAKNTRREIDEFTPRDSMDIGYNEKNKPKKSFGGWRKNAKS